MAQQSFEEFHTTWKEERNTQLDELITASKISPPPPPPPPTPSIHDLVHRVVAHYESYYDAKSEWVKQNYLLKLSPPWKTSLEDAFLWIGGWRPTTAFHLLYSLAGLQLEAQFSELIRGVKTGDLGDLSADQLARADELQRSTIKIERGITEEMAMLQEKMADTEIVELSRDVSESIRVQGGRNSMHRDRVNSTLKPKEESYLGLFQCADDLRLSTLKGVIGILSPIQAVHFLIAATELQMRVHEWGEEREENHHASSNTGEAT